MKLLHQLLVLVSASAIVVLTPACEREDLHNSAQQEQVSEEADAATALTFREGIPEIVSFVGEGTRHTHRGMDGEFNWLTCQ